MRELLTEILSSDPEIEVVGAAADPWMSKCRGWTDSLFSKSSCVLIPFRS
jgi:hypothetical protein